MEEGVGLTNFVKTAVSPKDLLGTMVPFDVTKDDWMIGHHVECWSIQALANSPDYIVNGELLLPSPIMLKLFDMYAADLRRQAAEWRPATTDWMPTVKPKLSWWAKVKEALRDKGGV